MQPPDTIRKLHALATHPATPEHERAQARKALDRLMAKWNLTEEDLTSDVRVEFSLVAANKGESSLMFRVLVEILDRCEDLHTSFRKGPKRGQETFYYNLTMTEQCDYRACLSWYQKLLQTDLREARAALKQTRLDALTKIKVAQLALKAIPSAFTSKYEIGDAAFARYWQQRNAAHAESDLSPLPGAVSKEKPQTAKQIRGARLRYQARQAAEDGLADGSRWEKPVGNMGGGVKELGNGDAFQLTND